MFFHAHHVHVTFFTCESGNNFNIQNIQNFYIQNIQNNLDISLLSQMNKVTLKTWKNISIWSLADRCANFTLKVLHVMKLQKDWTLKTSSEKMTLICVNMHSYAFHQSGFTSHLTMKYLVGARLSESFSMYLWRSLMTNFNHGHKTTCMYP